MTSFLIDRNSPIRTVGDSSAAGLHHRSRHSTESENGSPHHHQHPNSSSGSGQQRQEEGKEKDTFPKDEKPRDREQKGGPSMFSYFKSELTRSYKLEGDASEFVQRRDRIYVSVSTPKSLEKFCAFGLLQCLDSFLFIMTFLPLRILVAIMSVLTYPFSVMFFRKKAMLNPAQICDLLKGVILVVSCFITSNIDTSMVYHIVRTQSTIKFYVIYNMLDVMDKLVSGFGQDVLDSLYWTAVEPRGRKREHFGTIFHLMFAIAYVVIHTGLILIQAITLNVAFNSHNKSLLTIMLSNNFVEIKSNLFKRLDKNTLCQITYVDVKERFHYFVLLLFILIHNLLEKNWLRDQASIYFFDALIVLGTEVIVDWIKHSFINKINEFSASYYTDFAIGLAQDIASSQKKHALTDFSDQVCRRMGFTPIPLTCLLYMVCRKSFEISGPVSWLIVFMMFLCLFTTKVLNSIILLGWAQYLITQGEKQAASNVIVGNSQVIPKKDNNESDKKRVKTESISHCPDMTSHLTPAPMTASHKSEILTDSVVHAHGSQTSYLLPQQTEIFPVSNQPLTEVPSSKSDWEPSGNQSVEFDVQLPAEDTDDSSISSHKLSQALSLVLDKELDGQVYDNDIPVEDCRQDGHHIELQDGSDTSSSLLQDSQISSNVSDSSNLLETQDFPSWPQESHQPFMLKLSSSFPPPTNQENKNEAPMFHKRDSLPPPSHNAAEDEFCSAPSTELKETKAADSISPFTFSDVHCYVKEEAGDTSLEKPSDS